MTKHEYEQVSKFSRHNKSMLQNDNICGCYFCMRIFPTHEITEYCLEGSDDEEVTAICPHCKIDAVIGEGSGYVINEAFLRSMRGYAFKGYFSKDGE